MADVLRAEDVKKYMGEEGNTDWLRWRCLPVVCRVMSVMLTMAMLGLTGCAGFFVRPTTTTTTTPGGTTINSGDFAYVSNSSTGPTYLDGYNLSGGALTAVSGSPVNVGFIPVGLAVSPNNGFLYVASIASAPSPGLYLYSIGSAGALTVANGGTALFNDQISSIALSPDGGWLFSLNVTGLVMNEYQVNTSTGLLTFATSVTLPGSGCVATAGTSTPASQTCTVAVGPNGAYVAVALGVAGTAVFPFSSTGGLTNAAYDLIPSGTTTATPTGDFSVALDSNNFAYIARTGTLAVYAVTASAATLQATLQSTANYASGSTPRSATLSGSGGFVYTANEGTGTVSGYSVGSTGVLTALTGSPYTGPVNVSALGRDNSGSYMLAAGYDATKGVQLFSIGATGLLTPVSSVPSGTAITYPAVLALTH